MADTTATAGITPVQGGTENQPAGGSQEKTFTQEEVNSMLAKERREMQAKYSDYTKYKEAYEEAQKKQEASKSELEKAIEAKTSAEAELAALKAENERAEWVAAVSKETGVPEAALHGSTEDEVRACADALKEYFAKPSAPKVETGKPSTHEGGTGDPLRDAINEYL